MNTFLIVCSVLISSGFMVYLFISRAKKVDEQLKNIYDAALNRQFTIPMTPNQRIHKSAEERFAETYQKYTDKEKFVLGCLFRDLRKTNKHLTNGFLATAATIELETHGWREGREKFDIIYQEYRKEYDDTLSITEYFNDVIE